MKIYDFYIFNKAGLCIFHKSWEGKEVVKDLRESKKLVFGITYSLRDLCSKLSPDGSENLEVMRTNNFAIHQFKSATGLAFVLSSDAACPNQYSRLQEVYADYFTEYVSKNPLFEDGQMTVIDSPLFREKLEEFFKM